MILLLDNYDSFVHNLARYFRRLGCETKIVRSDAADVDFCRQLMPDAIVISPGPRRPEVAGSSVEVIRDLGPTVPILGVCLGHQSIGYAFGAKIIQCGPVHGSDSEITHDGHGVFQECPDPMTVGRYHSLVIDPESVPESLTVSATDSDGLIMGIRHREYPVHGVQFHPESVLTEDGPQLIRNFLAIAAANRETSAT